MHKCFKDAQRCLFGVSNEHALPLHFYMLLTLFSFIDRARRNGSGAVKIVIVGAHRRDLERVVADVPGKVQ